MAKVVPAPYRTIQTALYFDAEIRQSPPYWGRKKSTKNRGAFSVLNTTIGKYGTGVVKKKAPGGAPVGVAGGGQGQLSSQPSDLHLCPLAGDHDKVGTGT